MFCEGKEFVSFLKVNKTTFERELGEEVDPSMIKVLSRV